MKKVIAITMAATILLTACGDKDIIVIPSA